VLEGNAVESRQALDFAVVRDDDRNLAVQFPGPPAVQQIGHAVQILRAEEGHARPPVARGQLPAHVQSLGHRRELRLEGLQIEGLGVGAQRGCVAARSVQRPLHAHEEEAQFVVLMLVGVEDVRSMLVEHRGNTRDQTSPVRAIDEQNSGFFHAFFSLNHHLR